ncbi:hypothetical protein GT037_002301, partial [Alternaria burnsii]
WHNDLNSQGSSKVQRTLAISSKVTRLKTSKNSRSPLSRTFLLNRLDKANHRPLLFTTTRRFRGEWTGRASRTIRQKRRKHSRTIHPISNGTECRILSRWKICHQNS